MRRAHAPAVPGLFLAAVLLAGCGPADEAGDAPAPAEGVVEVAARDFEFDAPETLRPGWTTFRFTNLGEQEHFFYVYRLPDDVTYGHRREAMGPFGRVWNDYASGRLSREEADQAFAETLPEWFFTGLVPSGGPALTEPGTTATSTVRLEPGTYVVECYVKTPQGTYHTERGMQRELTVAGEPTGAEPPEADAELALSNYEIAVSGDLSAGKRTVAVRVEEDPGGMMLHDVNLFRLEDGVTVDEIVAWMDWMDLEGFRAPAPGTSLGGMDHLAAGRTGFVTVELTPGRYAWVSEAYGARGMTRAFTVE